MHETAVQRNSHRAALSAWIGHHQLVRRQEPLRTGPTRRPSRAFIAATISLVLAWEGVAVLLALHALRIL